MKKSTFLLLAIVGAALLGCGSKDSAILSAIDDYAATKGNMPGQGCDMLDKRDQEEGTFSTHYYKYFIEAGYMEKTPTGGKLTALGLSKVRDWSESRYRACWMDVRALKVIAYDDAKPVKTSDGGEKFRVGVDIEFTPSEMGKTMIPFIAKSQGISEEAVIKNLRRGGEPIINRWIRMKKSADGKYTVSDASY